MRRSDRQVTDFTELTDILCRADTIRLGLHGEVYPYVVPLSFGFEASEGKITLYFHGAKEGLKHDLLAKNPRVCVETDIFHRYTAVGSNVTTEYESFIGFGKARRVTGEEAVKGMDLLLSHCGYDGFVYDRAALEFTWVYKIELDSFTGKRRFVERQGTETGRVFNSIKQGLSEAVEHERGTLPNVKTDTVSIDTAIQPAYNGRVE